MTPPITRIRTRPDGRTPTTLRPLSAEISPLTRPDGSSKLSSGHTQILCAIYGPISPRHPHKEHPTQATISIIFRCASNNASSSSSSTSSAAIIQGSSEKEWERFIGDTLGSCIHVENYPRTVIEIVLQVVTSDGGVLGTALNAAVLALLDAGIDMRCIPVATTCVVASGDNISSKALLLDPCEDEERSSDSTSWSPSSLVIVTEGGNDDGGVLGCMTFFNGSGGVEEETYWRAVRASQRASKAVAAFMRMAIEGKIEKECATLWSE